MVLPLSDTGGMSHRRQLTPAPQPRLEVWHIAVDTRSSYWLAKWTQKQALYGAD